MNTPNKLSLPIKQFKKSLLLFLFIHLCGCSNIYLQWWDEEMFLYRPSVIESAAMRSATKQKLVTVVKDKTLKLNYGLSLETVDSLNPDIVQVSIGEDLYPNQPNKTIIIKGMSIGLTTVIAYLVDGKRLEIIVNVTDL